MSSRQPWTPVEDQILVSFVKKYGVGNWVLISQKMHQRANTHSRSGKQCRQRWHNHLDPEVTKKSWTLQQQKLMFDAHKKYGNRWSDIASELKGRTDSDVKNHFYSIIRKCLRRLSKMVGQKNSTYKIRNVKPSLLSRLLEGNNDSKSTGTLYDNMQETSDALFKFILQRENLNFKSLQKKTRDLLQKLVDRIAKMSEDKDGIIKSFISQNENEENEQKIEKKPEMVRQSSRLLRSSMQIKSEKENVKALSSKQKKLSKVKKIKKQPSIKTQRRESKVSTAGKQNKSNYSPPNQGFDIDIRIVEQKNPYFRLDSIISEMQSDGFRPFDTEYNGKQMRRRSSNSRESILSDRGFFQEVSIPELTQRRRSSVSSENRRMMSTTDNYTNFCITPPVPTPGFNGNLFETFSKLSPGQLTLGDLESEVDCLRKRIQRNNRSTAEQK